MTSTYEEKNLNFIIKSRYRILIDDKNTILNENRAKALVRKIRARMCSRAGHLDVPNSGGLPPIEKGTADNGAKGRDEMEVRLPLAWKSHPVLIDPHPSAFSPRVSRASSSSSPSPNIPSSFPSNHRRSASIPFISAASLSLSHRALSLFFNVRPLSLRQRVLSHPSITLSSPLCLVSLAKKFTFAKKKGKRREKSMRDVDWPHTAGFVPTFVRGALMGVA